MRRRQPLRIEPIRPDPLAWPVHSVVAVFRGDGEAGRDQVVILTHKMWKQLGADPQIINKQIRMDNQPYTVVGVLGPGFRDRIGAQLTVPLVFKPEQLNHEYHWINVMGRLKTSASLQQAQADIDVITKRIASLYPISSKGRRVVLEPLRSAAIPNDRRFMLWLMLGTLAMILLIACVNIANLLLAKRLSRQKEVAIRVALGATRATIFSQFLTESLLLAAVGGLFGIAVGYVLLQGSIVVLPLHLLPAEASLRLNLPVTAFTLVVTALAGVLFGCAPAWYASRIKAGDGLKEGGASGMGGGQRRLRQALVVGEVALALSLLFWGGSVDS